MGKRSTPSPFAPLERDVEPPLRRLHFVRARYAILVVTYRGYGHLVTRHGQTRGTQQKHSADGAGAPTNFVPPIDLHRPCL
jgi:hypothetical protein